MADIVYKRAAGLYDNRDEAERVVRALKDAGFDNERVSIIAKDAEPVLENTETKEIGNKADEGATTGALTGGALGGIAGLLVGLGALAIPGIGPILLAGAEATAIVTTLTGAGIGAATGSLVGALIGLGIPEEKAQVYSDRVSGGSFLVMVTGTGVEIDRVANIMRSYEVEEFDIYDIPGATPTAVTDVDEDIRTRSDLDDREKIRLYEERLLVNKQREKTGEVTIGKRVATETAKVAVPVEKERIVVERKDAVDGTVVNPGKIEFGSGQVARVEVYEESADIEKQAFVREEVSVRKEATTETVEAKDTIRREELEVETEGDVIKHG